MGVNGKALQLHSAYKGIFFTASHVRIHISTIFHEKICISTTSHAKISIRYCKSHKLRLTCNKIEGSYDKIIMTIVPNYITKKISLVCCRWHCYSCCTLVTIQTATNSRYFLV